MTILNSKGELDGIATIQKYEDLLLLMTFLRYRKMLVSFLIRFTYWTSRVTQLS